LKFILEKFTQLIFNSYICTSFNHLNLFLFSMFGVFPISFIGGCKFLNLK